MGWHEPDQSKGGGTVQPHVHLSAVHGLAVIALVVAVFGTAHLLALPNDTRASRALVSLGF